MTTREIQDSLTPAAVLADLKAGNERFVSGKPHPRDWIELAEATANGQHPKAVILGCIDSRVPVEVIFDQAIGDVFVARVAGNFVNNDILGSMEFATAIAGAKLVVVLGHTSCGAVMGALDDARLGHITGMLANIKPAIEKVRESGEEIASSNESLLNRVTDENVRQAVRDVKSRSDVMATAVSEDKLRVVGAVYELNTGRVRWLDE
ncbi:MAG: carbonic anhydrase family protein [Phycisphaerales bacterium]